MLATKRQIAGTELLKQLEEFTREREFPRRVIDSVTELRKELELAATPADAEEFMLQIPKLLEQIGKKYETKGKDEPQLPEETVSFAEIQKRVDEINRLLEDNAEALQMQYSRATGTARVELENNLRELLHTQAKSDVLQNGGRFCNYVASAEQNYNARIGQSLQSFVGELFQCCDSAMVKIKSLLTHVKAGNEPLQISQRSIYQQYDSRYGEIKQKTQQQAAQLAAAPNEASQWAASCLPQMEQIKKKTVKRRNRFLLLPLLAVIALILVFRLVNMTESYLADKAAVQEQEVSKDKGMAEQFGQFLFDEAEDVMNQAKKGIEEGIQKIVTFLLICAYLIYIFVIFQRYKVWLSNAFGNYLAPEFTKFMQANTLERNTQQKFAALRGQLQGDYRTMVADMLGNDGYQQRVEVNSEKQQFEVLARQWENVRRME